MTFLRRQIGERNMRELLFSGELIDAARAKEIGLGESRRCSRRRDE